MIWDEFLRHFRFCDEEDSAQSTHENGYIKPRKTFWRNSKQLLKYSQFILRLLAWNIGLSLLRQNING
jgi:hypothetical protein